MSLTSQKKINSASTIVNLNNKINTGMKSKITSKYIKKNLIIIEILENFLIDEEFSKGEIDIEKLKMLLLSKHANVTFANYKENVIWYIRCIKLKSIVIIYIKNM